LATHLLPLQTQEMTPGRTSPHRYLHPRNEHTKKFALW
jgi:hypothetical protein